MSASSPLASAFEPSIAGQHTGRVGSVIERALLCVVQKDGKLINPDIDAAGRVVIEDDAQRHLIGFGETASPAEGFDELVLLSPYEVEPSLAALGDHIKGAVAVVKKPSE